MEPRRTVPEHNIQLLILPGLGGDHRMAYPQLTLPYRIITPDLIEMRGGETLEEYSRRFGECLLASQAISLSQPLFLAGYSIGSAIAIEMASIFRPKGVIVIGGLRSGRELRPLVRFFGKHIVTHMPLFAFGLAAPLIRFVMRRNSGIPERDVDLSHAMYRAFSRQLFRTGYETVAKWEGLMSDGQRPRSAPLLRIHGEHDHIISCPPERNDVVTLKKAKHLVHFAQPQEVNRLIEDFIDRAMRQADESSI